MYYIKDITNKFKILIDTGAGISIFKPKTAENYKQRFPENVIIQGITDQKIIINESVLIPFTQKDPHKVYVYDLDIDFDGLIGADFLEHYHCIVDIKNKQLITNFKTVPLFKVIEDLPKPEFNKIGQNHFNQNKIQIDGRTEKVYKLKCNLANTDAILSAQENEKVRLPNALVRVDENGEFLTTIINPNAIPKFVDFSNLKLEPLQKFKSIFNFNTPNSDPHTQTDRTFEIKNQLRLDHLNEEEAEMVTQLCLDFQDIFYLEGDNLTFTNEIKHSIDINNSRPIFTKSYRHPQVHKEEVKSQVSKMLNQGIILHSISPWSSPVWVVPKKLDASGKQKWRVVVDYRKLNEVTIDDKYPLPNISDLLHQLGKC